MPTNVSAKPIGFVTPETQSTWNDDDQPIRLHNKPVRILMPTRYTELEPPLPLSVIDDDPVFPPAVAATILGVSRETLKRWRQLGQGPDYFQYGEGGPVRYALSALRRFQTQHMIKPSRNTQ
jgi:hypothetical protein